MSLKNHPEFVEAFGKADPLVEAGDQISSAVALLRVTWAALQAKEWLDDQLIEHCADCLERVAVALDEPRKTIVDMAIDIQERARAELGG